MTNTVPAAAVFDLPTLSCYNAFLMAQASVAEATDGPGKGTAEAALELCVLAPALLQTGKIRPLSLSANCASSSYTALCRQQHGDKHVRSNSLLKIAADVAPAIALLVPPCLKHSQICISPLDLSEAPLSFQPASGAELLSNTSHGKATELIVMPNLGLRHMHCHWEASKTVHACFQGR